MLCAFFISLNSVANATYIIQNDSIINEKVSSKVESLGEELYKKTSIGVYVTLPVSLEKKSVGNFAKELAKTLKEPYVLLVLAKDEKQVEIVNSKVLDDKFDKEGILSPFPWSGSIIPLLSGKKDNDNYNVAVLNGYADIVEQLAKSKNIVLEGALGDVNRDIYHYLKIGIYSFLLFIIGKYFYRKVRKKSE
ncbi:MAG TPA: TPM domain-containing protein [Sulfurospirillum arcachonense]|nr:TPM domain-containing protein [Sulfurospirillum arcachonense]